MNTWSYESLLQTDATVTCIEICISILAKALMVINGMPHKIHLLKQAGGAPVTEQEFIEIDNDALFLGEG